MKNEIKRLPLITSFTPPEDIAKHLEAYHQGQTLDNGKRKPDATRADHAQLHRAGDGKPAHEHPIYAIFVSRPRRRRT